MAPMDRSFIESLIESGRPFEVVTASGDRFEIPHRDFIGLTPKKTALIIYFYREGDNLIEEPRFVYVPLLTVTSAGPLGQPSRS